MTLFLTDGSGEIAPADLMLAAAVYHKLAEHYPGHQWRVNADHETGILTVQLLYLDKLRRAGNWGYLLKIAGLDAGLRGAVRAGGELLERFGLPRKRMRVDWDTKQEAIAHGLDLSL